MKFGGVRRSLFERPFRKCSVMTRLSLITLAAPAETLAVDQLNVSDWPVFRTTKAWPKTIGPKRKCFRSVLTLSAIAA